VMSFPEVEHGFDVGNSFSDVSWQNATLGIWIIIFCVSRALSDSAAVS
jgi:hypothetical protein